MAISVNNGYWCFVPMCKNTSKITPEKRFITMPRDMKMRKLWWRAAHREYPITTGSSYCCEDHFNMEEDLQNYRYLQTMGGAARLKPGVVPHLFDCQGRGVKSNTNRISFQKKRTIQEMLNNKENDEPDTSFVRAADQDGEDGNPSHFTEPAVKHIGIQVQRPFATKAVQVRLLPLQADAACNTDTVIKVDEDITGISNLDSDKDCDTSPDFAPSGSEDSDESNRTRELSLLATRGMIMENPMRYIGIQRDHLYILDILCEKMAYSQRGQTMTKKDALLMILMKIRTGIASDIIADMFGITKSGQSRLFSRYIPTIASCLQGLISWPSSEVIRSRLPNSFKAYYNRVESIIDCFEIQIAKPSVAMSQSMSWSEYKKCNSIKYLISATPDGLINFVSTGKPGRCSDMGILRESGYLDHLREGVTVLADRGFKEVETDLATKGCKLVRPASVGKDEKLPAKDVLNMKTIAGLRIHIERVIRRVRVYKFLDMHSCIPLCMLDLVDDIVRIVCGLVNLQDRIVKV